MPSSLLSMAFLTSNVVVSAFASVLSTTGQTVVLDGVSFYLPAETVATLDVSSLPQKVKDASLTPLTVITTDSSSYDAQTFEATIANFTTTDDVFSAGFLESVYVQYTGQQSYESSPKLNSVQNVTDAVWSSTVSQNASIPNGPYFVTSSGAVHQAWRLYSDFADTFS